MLIIISGRKGSGKSTLAGILAHKLRGVPGHGSPSIQSFANALKKIAATSFGIGDVNHTTFVDRSKRDVVGKYGLTPREFWQRFGCAIRDVCPDIWIEKLAAQIKETSDGTVIVDDARFPNEMQWGIDNGAMLIRLTRDNPEEATDGHHSETSLKDDDEYDWTTVPPDLNEVQTGEYVLECIKSG